MKGAKIFGTLFSVFLFLSCSKKTIPTTESTRNIEFIQNDQYSLTQVVDKAAAEQKLVFLDFYADWCLPCKLLVEEVYNQKAIYQLYNQSFINYKVDVEKNNGPNLRLMFGADELPTLLVLNEKGQVVDRYEGPATQSGLLAFARNVLKNKVTE